MRTPARVPAFDNFRCLFRRASRSAVHGAEGTHYSVNATRPVHDSAGRRAEQAGRLCYPACCGAPIAWLRLRHRPCLGRPDTLASTHVSFPRHMCGPFARSANGSIRCYALRRAYGEINHHQSHPAGARFRGGVAWPFDALLSTHSFSTEQHQVWRRVHDRFLRLRHPSRPVLFLHRLSRLVPLLTPGCAPYCRRFGFYVVRRHSPRSASIRVRRFSRALRPLLRWSPRRSANFIPRVSQGRLILLPAALSDPLTWLQPTPASRLRPLTFAVRGCDSSPANEVLLSPANATPTLS
jgi:hypothetical protein